MKFKEKLSLVPHKPGSYQMKDKNGVIIYVGKAKDLNKRLNSYFNRQFGRPLTFDDLKDKINSLITNEK